MAISPFDICKHLNEKTNVDADEVEASYAPYVINRAMSNNMDSLILAEVMNQYHFLDKDIQYDFYYQGLPKGKRFGKWFKPDDSNKELINSLCELFEVSERVAKKFLPLINDETREKIRTMKGEK